jgi:2-oxoglutarate ferredoxin oxidoreductase subunit alpha
MIGVTSSSGPGIALKTEAMGLAVSAELPLVVVNWQRGGPSTGLPTKTEQSDLYQAVYGRNGDTPIPVISAQSAGDCFDAAIDATRIALRHMTPVILLADGYLSNAAEPWRIPDLDDYAAIDSNTTFDATLDPQRAAFNRNPETLGRPWITPGIARMAHRIGGIEKDIQSGHISYDPANHQAMTDLRRRKVAGIDRFLPDQTLELGTLDSDVLLVGWGSTYGPLYQAARITDAAFLHLRYLNPLPKNLASLLENFKTILVVEMNDGQLSTLLRDRLGVRPIPVTKVTGQPFKISELTSIVEKARTSA